MVPIGAQVLGSTSLGAHQAFQKVGWATARQVLNKSYAYVVHMPQPMWQSRSLTVSIICFLQLRESHAQEQLFTSDGPNISQSNAEYMNCSSVPDLISM